MAKEALRHLNKRRNVLLEKRSAINTELAVIYDAINKLE